MKGVQTHWVSGAFQAHSLLNSTVNGMLILMTLFVLIFIYFTKTKLKQNNCFSIMYFDTKDRFVIQYCAV